MNYLGWLFVFIFIPVLLLSIKYGRFYKRYKKVFIESALAVILFSTIWDYFAVLYGTWFFYDHNLIGVKIFEIPLEEFFLFILLTPFFGILTLALKERYKT